MLRHLALIVLLWASVCSVGAQPAPKPPARNAAVTAAPPAALLARLRRGVNLSHWWWKPPAVEEGRIERLITAEDVALIKASGITHVRIPIDPGLISDAKDRLNQHRMMELTRAVSRFHAAGIATVIDAHPSGTSTTSMQIDKNPGEWERELAAFWAMLAPCWKNTQPELLAVELLNEPNGLKDDKEWPAAQERLRAAVRKALPKHTIILTGDDWGGIDSLVKLQPSTDTNVIYSFHFYDPHTFTHQQATWGAPMWKDIKGLRYPFDKANADEVLARAASGDPKATSSVRRYAKEQWSAAKVEALFAKAKTWAAEHNPPAALYLGEFGAYRAGCDEPSRTAWLEDVRRAAEKNNIGWCAWDYQGGFGITRKEGRTARTLDEPAARALGLTVPPSRKP